MYFYLFIKCSVGFDFEQLFFPENETFSVCSVWETITGPHGMTHSEAAHIGLPSH